MELSKYQQAIMDWVVNGSGNAIVEAVAGSGKTTTLIEMLSRLNGNVYLAAYNKKIAEEINDRIVSAGLDTTRIKGSTFHAAGYSSLRYHVKSTIKVEANKLDLIMQELAIPEEYKAFVRRMVTIAKQRAFGFLTDVSQINCWMEAVDHFSLDVDLPDCDGQAYDCDEKVLREGLRYSWKVLKHNNEVTSMIDFEDMIYLPLVHNVRCFANDWLLIDEAQDTNPARRALAKKMLKPGGRLVAVGDRAQAIYGFTGADADSLDLIESEFGCKRLPLTISYRCPQSVVRLAQTWVKHIEASPTAIEGSTKSINIDEFYKNLDQLKNTDAILCRNTKPLVDIAYGLIRKGIACRVEGKEIGKGLINLVKRMNAKSLDKLDEKLAAFKEREVQKYMAKGKETAAEMIADRVDTLDMLIERMQEVNEKATVDDLIRMIDNMFGDSERDKRQLLTLSTIHKSKGREWKKVYWWGPNRFQPSPYARKEWQMGQEINLMYVAVTRAKEELVTVNV